MYWPIMPLLGPLHILHVLIGFHIIASTCIDWIGGLVLISRGVS